MGKFFVYKSLLTTSINVYLFLYIFPTHNLVFHWRWLDWIQAIFLNLFYIMKIWKRYKRLTDLSPISCHNSPAFLANSAKFKPGNLPLIRGRFSFIQRKYDDWFLFGCPGALVLLWWSPCDLKFLSIGWWVTWLNWFNPNWHEAGWIYPPYNFWIGFRQLNFHQKFPNIFGGENWDKSG